MPTDPHELNVMPSIFDRLTASANDELSGAGYTMPEIIACVQRDLENLLNTHNTAAGLCPDCPEAQRSVLAYGLPDLGSFVSRTAKDCEEIGLVLEKAIRLFEPRLSDVRAELLRAENDTDRTVHFRIVARLWVEPAPEVAFDTVLELTSGRYSVKTSSA